MLDVGVVAEKAVHHLRDDVDGDRFAGAAVEGPVNVAGAQEIDGDAHRILDVEHVDRLLPVAKNLDRQSSSRLDGKGRDQLANRIELLVRPVDVEVAKRAYLQRVKSRVETTHLFARMFRDRVRIQPDMALRCEVNARHITLQRRIENVDGSDYVVFYRCAHIPVEFGRPEHGRQVVNLFHSLQRGDKGVNAGDVRGNVSHPRVGADAVLWRRTIQRQHLVAPLE